MCKGEVGLSSDVSPPEPVWSPDDSELFYRSADQLMVVGLADPVRPEAPRPLWADNYRRHPQNIAAPNPNYDIDADDQRFRSMGFVSVIIVSALFALGLPLVLL